ncbi:tRNA (5-methylaminomethyl-2-thiouridine)(34)-methyltransferase MnmD [Actibacterium sp. 188UL27-1]|uniref:tRNA (5-methylaminomethyl-2-thiouridine)(34)-methyltransferase MnmD n=1 Tax=Actibacterium sp. 188UL27-1 TaxID=2786961 RepID=UPI00195C2F32|nr:tRNA (5-methylaminomethyl-2-thiouridine)(34)-methyltransferase MnmD [Actibacterium sp. 188UL27-1]MBM7069367.1 tRNA (5-methylaminomethyl-2-thiouridine)(34)-methyltransferase MnmD [Actibacterium sp. 188UL27-1]
MPTDQQEPIDWQANGVPVSQRFDDPFYSLEDGLAETRHVFITGNGLSTRLRPGFAVAELGVGTGLNIVALALAAEQVGIAGITYTGFEAYPLSQADIERALIRFFPVLPGAAWALINAWRPDGTTLFHGGLTATILIGDARQTLPRWKGAADAWFLDGFSPAKNPELWEADLMMQVARHTRPGGTFATYTAAGHVRRALDAAGFTVTRQPGFGRKRHMTTGQL